MLEEILESLKKEAGEHLSQVAGLDTGKIDDVVGITGEVVKEKVTSEIAGGNLSTLMNLFSNSSNNSSADSLQNSIADGIMSNLMKKLGLDGSAASGIAGAIVPMIIDKITGVNSKTPDDDPSPLTDLFGGGGAADAIGGLLNKLF